MRRRSFISSLPLLSGASLYAPERSHAAEQPTRSFQPVGTVTEPAQELPVVEKTDVLVIGGGPAGVAAAISAGRAGARTVLVERYNHLGGLWTGGLVLPLLSTHGLQKNGKFEQVIFGISNEIAQKLNGMGMAIHEINPVVDPEAAKYVLEVMIKESGVHMLYHCWASNVIVENNKITSVILDTKSGRVAVQAKMVIDCTGDGDIFHLAGEEYEELKYNLGLVHRLGNIDRIDKTKPGYKDMPIGDATPIPSVNWVNMGGEKDQDGIDMYNLARLQQQYRIAIWESYEKVHTTPGYEEVFLLDTASQLGVRMSRILHGEYTLTMRDTMTYQRFDDTIGVSGAWTSVSFEGKKFMRQERPSWQIPYRSLVPKTIDNLLVAGRCFSFEPVMAEDARIIGTCLITGHGAGVGAAVAVDSNTSARDVNIKRVQHILKDQKVYMG